MNPELAVEERLRRLESQVRRARMWSVAMTVALGAVVFASMQAPQEQVLKVESVTAREFRVVDESGLERGVFWIDGRRGPEESAVSLSLSGPPGSGNQVSLLAGATSTELRLRDGSSAEVLACTNKDGAGFHASSLAKVGSPIYLPTASLTATGGEGVLELHKLDTRVVGSTTSIAMSGPKVRVSPEGGLVQTKP
ncbi:MAG: hypothetical protein IPJ77_22715 [Planctomycetes bacterium]|nr:hypothetical protein [Planctomycetota bacterium]